MGGGTSKKKATANVAPDIKYQINVTNTGKYNTKNLKPKESWNVNIFNSSIQDADAVQRNTTVTDDVSKDWKLQEKLGVGSTSTVFKCVSSTSPDLACACKVINKKRLGVSKKRQLQMIGIAKNEVELMKKLSHDCIVRLMGFYETDKDLYVITELMNGGELLDIVMDSGNLSNFDALTVARRIGAGIMHLHNIGIMHRDIKPENILLKVKGDLNTVKLIDFGLSKSATNTKSFIGTQGYLAPEMSPTRREYTPAVDMWALGVTLYAVMTGCLPFDDDQEALNQDGGHIVAAFPKDMWADRDKRSVDAVQRLLALDPKKRITAKQFCNHPWLKHGHDIIKLEQTSLVATEANESNKPNTIEPKTDTSMVKNETTGTIIEGNPNETTAIESNESGNIEATSNTTTTEAISAIKAPAVNTDENVTQTMDTKEVNAAMEENELAA
jgi:serine/threonine protein kinase